MDLKSINLYLKRYINLDLLVFVESVTKAIKCIKTTFMHILGTSDNLELLVGHLGIL